MKITKKIKTPSPPLKKSDTIIFLPKPPPPLPSEVMIDFHI